MKIFFSFIIFNLSLLFSNGLTGDWRLIQFRNFQTAAIEFEPSTERQHIIFNFQDNGQTGKFSGKTSSNDCYGAYVLDEENRFKLKEFEGTMVGETKWGWRFDNAFKQSTSYRIDGDTLFLLFDSDKQAMIFIKTDSILNKDLRPPWRN